MPRPPPDPTLEPHERHLVINIRNFYRLKNGGEECEATDREILDMHIRAYTQIHMEDEVLELDRLCIELLHERQHLNSGS